VCAVHMQLLSCKHPQRTTAGTCRRSDCAQCPTTTLEICCCLQDACCNCSVPLLAGLPALECLLETNHRSLPAGCPLLLAAGWGW
jgi:hypothetical protein